MVASDSSTGGSASDPKSKLYPVDGEVIVGGTAAAIKIAHLDQRGFVAYVISGLCHVGQHCQCTISLRTAPLPLQAQGQVFKTYDTVTPNTGRVDRIVEVLFTKIGDSEKHMIKTYLEFGG